MLYLIVEAEFVSVKLKKEFVVLAQEPSGIYDDFKCIWKGETTSSKLALIDNFLSTNNTVLWIFVNVQQCTASFEIIFWVIPIINNRDKYIFKP